MYFLLCYLVPVLGFVWWHIRRQSARMRICRSVLCLMIRAQALSLSYGIRVRCLVKWFVIVCRSMVIFLGIGSHWFWWSSFGLTEFSYWSSRCLGVVSRPYILIGLESVKWHDFGHIKYWIVHCGCWEWAWWLLFSQLLQVRGLLDPWRHLLLMTNFDHEVLAWDRHTLSIGCEGLITYRHSLQDSLKPSGWEFS